ncbi:hypothetical protein OIU78_008578 [Salix suchowensis]|nr:hypothetical protein OIU78_008578 [Salix suchowensis]
MKAFLIIVCILLASIVFSPSATCTARRVLAGKDPSTGFGPVNSAPPCGGSKKNCNPNPQKGPGKPKKKCQDSPHQSDCRGN